jgi:hypothetical protein
MLIPATYPSDVSDKEWALVAPYLVHLSEESAQRTHALREVFFNDLRYVVKTGLALDAQRLATLGGSDNLTILARWR